ncbi:MAG TPA: EcsC family protein [Clostridia bacterium]|nr:EcsC family protein [Clostridia bacterium]
MPEAAQNSSWLRRRVEAALKDGFAHAYESIKVDPEEYLMHLRMAHNLPVQTYEGMFSVGIEQLDDVAADTIRAGMKMAAAEGAGFGLGGLLTLVPDMGVLSAITMRTVQKLSLVYGFQFNTDDEIAELWVAAASAAGVDISRELLERGVVNRFVPRVIQKVAVSASTEVVEKWAGRVIPLASSAIGAALNYYFVRSWGERAASHFREKHIRLRETMAYQRATISQLPSD